jgi:secreted PhoX family phosphatase
MTSHRTGSPTASFSQVLAARLDRRGFLGGSAGATLLALLEGCRTSGPLSAARGSGPLLGFTAVPMSRADAVVVPPGYEYRVVNAWGDPLMPGAPAFRSDASQPAAAQRRQAGMNHDGMAFFPLPRGSLAADRGLLAVNFEYTDDNLLTTEGMEPWTAEKVSKSQAAHGIGVFEVSFGAGADGARWRTVASSRYGRRITANTTIDLTGPAAGHDLLKTDDDPTGRLVKGTFNNCAGGRTPWGTWLSCEENVAPYFVDDSTGQRTRLAERYGIPTSKDSWGFRWQEFDPRFDAARHPNEPNRHGWVVELDPYDPSASPIKRTALGRMAHEGATATLARDGRVVLYMGDDDFRSKFEHIYKFVSDRAPAAGGLKENQDLLDRGTLYAARFNTDGTGTWLPLTFGTGPLTAANGFPSQADVLIGARLAADALGATYMDRPEWVAVHPQTKEVFCTLTNNSARGKGKPALTDTPLGADAANPRAPNTMGHIVRWQEDGADPAATRFVWNVFLQAGDPKHSDPLKRGNVKDQVAFAQPDGLYIDDRGVLWIQTDSSSQNMAGKDWDGIGNNQMLAADPSTGEVRRFLTAPVGSEVTGIAMAPDLRTLFVNIQHPGEAPLAHPGRNDPTRPKAHSSWPDGPGGGRPRSATIAIRRTDGGPVGT